MSYIGRKPTVGNFQICDAISVVNGQAAYTMQVGSVNVIPQSANHMIVSLNGTIQKPNSSFTVSGSTITFSSNLVTNDVIDFIQILGDVLDLGVPSDATVTTAKLASTSVTAAKLNNDIISGTTALTAEPADTDEFLVSDAGTLKRIDYSLIKGGGIANADQWYLTTTFQATGGTTIASNWSRSNYGTTLPLGTGMSQSSGIFSFPSTGYWFIVGQTTMNKQNQSYYCGINLETTDNNSSYVRAVESNGETTSQAGSHSNANFTFIKKVTNTSNSKVRLVTSAQATTNFAGNGNYLVTGLTFIRLGDV